MKKEIKTEILIHSSAEKIWDILIDFKNYPNWNPFITSIKGNVEKENKIVVSIKPPDGGKMTFRPRVLTKLDKQELTWLGSLFFKGIFDGKHTFRLEDNGDGTITFIQKEEFNGILVGIFNLKKTEDGFNVMNERLKERAETS